MSDDKLVKHMTGLITAGLDRVEQLKAQNLRLSGMCYDLNAEIELLREVLVELIQHTHNCERELTEDLHHVDFCGESVPLTNAREALKGGKP